MTMLSFQNDIPVSLYGFDDFQVRIAYRSGHIIGFPYQFFVEHLEELVSLPLLSSLEFKESVYLGRDNP